MLAFLIADEFNRIAYRNDVPENLHLICTQTADSYTDDNIALRIDKGVVELQLADNDPIFIKKEPESGFVVSGLKENQSIPSFEPVEFEDAEGLVCGYGILEWADEELGQYVITKNQKYAYRWSSKQYSYKT